jgi:hypothetical protein
MPDNPTWACYHCRLVYLTGVFTPLDPMVWAEHGLAFPHQGWKTINAERLTTRCFESILERLFPLLRRCSDLRHTCVTRCCS